jgi:hypothetical protein
MKRLQVVVLFLIMNTLVAFCPNIKTFYVATSSPIKYVPQAELITDYNLLIKAIFHYEAGFNALAYNPKENAVGGLQIRQCRIDHFNKLTNKNYTLQDMYDFEKSKEVFLYFATHNNRGNLIKGKSYEQVAKNWNGSGPMTEKYWQSIQNYLYSKSIQIARVEAPTKIELPKSSFELAYRN